MERRHELPGSITGGHVEPSSARDRTTPWKVNVRAEFEPDVLANPVEVDATDQEPQQLFPLLGIGHVVHQFEVPRTPRTRFASSGGARRAPSQSCGWSPAGCC